MYGYVYNILYMDIHIYIERVYMERMGQFLPRNFATKNSSDSKWQALQLPDKSKNCHALVPIEVIEFTCQFSHNHSSPKPTYSYNFLCPLMDADCFWIFWFWLKHSWSADLFFSPIGIGTKFCNPTETLEKLFLWQADATMATSDLIDIRKTRAGGWR